MTARTFCRLCPAYCGLEVDVVGDRIARIRGDREHPLSRGYSCRKGRNQAAQVHAPERLTSALRRRGAPGHFEPIARERALDEIADALRVILERDGPRAVATYSGTGLAYNALGMRLVSAWLRGLDSEMVFTSMTVDQPGKGVAAEWHGVWGAGKRAFSSADVTMLVGINPLVSGYQSSAGVPGWDPAALKRAKLRGHRLIVVDPRRTETARFADLHLQALPGSDPWILAAMIRQILEDGLADADFCARHAQGLDALRAAVAPFRPERAARRAGLPTGRIIEAARLFGTATRATADSGTGPSMSPHPNLSEYLLLCLTTVRGQWARAGERVPIPSVLSPDVAPRAHPLPDEQLPRIYRPSANAERTRIREVRRVWGEMPSAVLADEILLTGEGRIRALIVVGGNPLAAFPDQAKLQRALESLELLVCIDLRPTATTQLAHYVLPATHPLERSDLAALPASIVEAPFGQYTPAVVCVPGDCAEEWRYLVELARRLGTSIRLSGGAVDVHEPPDDLDLLQRMFPVARVPVREIARHPGGKVFDEFSDLRIEPADPGNAARLQLAHPSALAELASLCADEDGTVSDYPLLLACRRSKDVSNSALHELPGVPRTNPLFLHPEDLAALDLRAGAVVDVVSPDGRVTARVERDETMRRGVASMWHGYGGLDPQHADPLRCGTPLGRLISTDRDTDPISGMARQSAIPIRIERTPSSDQPGDRARERASSSVSRSRTASRS